MPGFTITLVDPATDEVADAPGQEEGQRAADKYREEDFRGVDRP